MLYETRICELPVGMEIGSKVLVIDYPNRIFTINNFVKEKINDEEDSDQIIGISFKNCPRIPMHKIVLKKPGQSNKQAFADPTNYINVAIGECDECKRLFPDSIAYYNAPNNKTFCKQCFFANDQLGKSDE